MVLEIIKTLEEYRSSDVSPTVRRKLRTHKIYDRTQYDLPLGRVIVDNTVEMVYFMYTDPDFAICISFVDTPMIEKLVNEFIQSPYKPSFPSSPASKRVHQLLRAVGAEGKMSMRDMLFDIYDLGIKDEAHYRKTYPTFYFRDHNRIREHINMASVTPKVYTMARPHPDPEWHKIAVWWNTFVKTGVHAKKQNLWVTSSPDTGKTMKVILPMIERAEGYEIIDHAEYWQPFIGPYDFAYSDEFSGRITGPTLNAFCSPKPMTLHAMGVMTRKTQNLPVIICSNFSPEDLYFRNDEVLNAILSRFTICTIKPSVINVF